MSQYRGLDGFFALGGVIVGTPNPRLNGALTAGATTLALGAATLLVGVLVPGDQFTIAGEAGTPLHTVTGSAFFSAVANAISGVTFTPAIAAGGAANNAAVTVISNSIVNTKMHTLNANQAMLDASVMGTPWKSFLGGQAEWDGTVDLFLDLADPEQLNAYNNLVSTGGAALPAVAFGIQQGPAALKAWYGGGLLSSFAPAAPIGDLITVKAAFKGSGPLLPLWT